MAAEPPGKSPPGRKFSFTSVLEGLGLAVLVLGSFAMISRLEYDSMSHGRQRRTQGDMKSLATELEDYREKNGHYPAAEDLDGALRQLPDAASSLNYFALDSWQHPYRYHAAGKGSGACSAGTDPQPVDCGPQHYTLASAGSDGIFAHDKLTDYRFGETAEYSCDLVMRDGNWLRQPSGPQRRGACSSE